MTNDTIDLLFDMTGCPIRTGDRIAKARQFGRTPLIVIHEALVRDGKLYLDNSKVAVRYPRRVLVLR